jgi:hypothetical protein
MAFLDVGPPGKNVGHMKVLAVIPLASIQCFVIHHTINRDDIFTGSRYLFQVWGH